MVEDAPNGPKIAEKKGEKDQKKTTGKPSGFPINAYTHEKQMTRG